MIPIIGSYMRWLHTRWPAGTVEKLPECGENGTTSVSGVRIVGDLTGIPLLKFSSDTGSRAVREILKEPAFMAGKSKDLLDLVIVGAGVSGISAAIEASKAGLNYKIFEATQIFSTVANFPKGKPIYTYPTEMTLDGGLQFTADVKEALLVEMEEQRKAAGVQPEVAKIDRIERRGGSLILRAGKEEIAKCRRVIVAIGRSGNFRKLGCPGEDLDKVYNRLFDPKEFHGRNVLVVGGGDSALETSIALASTGAHVTLSHRKAEFSRPKPENIEKLKLLAGDPEAVVGVENPTSERVTTAAGSWMREGKEAGSLRLELGSAVSRIEKDSAVLIDEDKKEINLPNDAVFTMIGREAPLDFFRRSGIRIRGEWRPMTWVSLILFLLFCVFLYHFKSSHPQEFAVQQYFHQHHLFPFNLKSWFKTWPAASRQETNVLYTLKDGLQKPSFYYTLAYCTCVVVFGARRIARRKTPYVTLQTLTLMCFQCLPLFLLPEIILPWMGRNGWFEPGRSLRWLADNLFESYDGMPGHERAYWRSYGFILAFPLNVYNVFTERPMLLWLGISALQTFVFIPLLIFRWGKGAYCGWICSCGALAETMGDTQRQKMPHGPVWNRVNMLGQGTLLFAFVILAMRIAGWIFPGTEEQPSIWIRAFKALFEGIPFLNYSWSVDIFLGGLIGVGFYFWFSGRVWCRFGCPLAALMHIYARFSRFRIFRRNRNAYHATFAPRFAIKGSTL